MEKKVRYSVSSWDFECCFGSSSDAEDLAYLIDELLEKDDKSLAGWLVDEYRAVDYYSDHATLADAERSVQDDASLSYRGRLCRLVGVVSQIDREICIDEESDDWEIDESFSPKFFVSDARRVLRELLDELPDEAKEADVAKQIKAEFDALLGEDFLVRCVRHRADIFGGVTATGDELIDAVLAMPEAKLTQAYAVASRRCKDGKHWYRVREMFGERSVTVFSDAGGLKIGNGAFSIIIPNGVGDGKTRYAVFADSAEFNDQMMDFVTSVSGDISIYSYDCGSDVDCTISGRYGIYRYDGLIAFVRWD